MSNNTAAAASRKHVELSLELKRKLIQEHEHGVPFTLLGKKYHIATSTAANIWRKKEFFLRSRMSGSRKRCNDRSKYKIVNQVTALFVKSMLERNHKIDGEVIKRFARTAAAQCNFKDFHGSNGWLDSFKKRENVCWVRRRGERAVAQVTVSANGAKPVATSADGGGGDGGENPSRPSSDIPFNEPSSSTGTAANISATSLAIANLAANEVRRSDSPNLSTAAAAAAVAASANQHDHHHHHHHHHHNHSNLNHCYGHRQLIHQQHQAAANFDDRCPCQAGNVSGGSSSHCCWKEQSCPRCTVAAAAAAIAALNSNDSAHERDHEIEDWFHGIPFLCQFFEEYQNMHQQPSQPAQQRRQPASELAGLSKTNITMLNQSDQNHHQMGSSDPFANCHQQASTSQNSGHNSSPPSSNSSSSSSIATSPLITTGGSFHHEPTTKSQFHQASHCSRSCASNYNPDGAPSGADVESIDVLAARGADDSQNDLLPMEDHQMFVMASDVARSQQYHRHSMTATSQPALTNSFRTSSSSADIQSMGGLQRGVLEAEARNRQTRTMSADMLSDMVVQQQQQQQQRYVSASEDDEHHLSRVAEPQQYQQDYTMATGSSGGGGGGGGEQMMEVNYNEAANDTRNSPTDRIQAEGNDDCLRMQPFLKQEPDGANHEDGTGCCSSSSCSSLNQHQHQHQHRFGCPNSGNPMNETTSSVHNHHDSCTNTSNSNDNNTQATDRESLTAMSIISHKTDYNSDDQEFYMNPSDDCPGQGASGNMLGACGATLDELSDHQDCCSDHLDSVDQNELTARCCNSLQAFRGDGANLGGVGGMCYMDEYEYENISTIRHYPLPMASAVANTNNNVVSLQDQQQQFVSSSSSRGNNLVENGVSPSHTNPGGQLDQTSPSYVTSVESSMGSSGQLRNSNSSATLETDNDIDQYQMGQQAQQQQQQQHQPPPQQQAIEYNSLSSALFESEQTIEHADHEEHNMLHNALMRSPEKLKLIDSIITLLNYASNYNQKMLSPLLEIKRCIERDLEVVLSDTNSSSQQQCCNLTPNLRQQQQQQQHRNLISASYTGDSRQAQRQLVPAAAQADEHDQATSRDEQPTAMEMIVGDI